MNTGELREAIVSVTELNGAWGQNMSETKSVLLRVGGRTYPLTAVSASFVDGRFVLVLDGDAPEREQVGWGYTDKRGFVRLQASTPRAHNRFPVYR